ncbi:MAG: DinB family protein, partial [Chloroflexota bacterium]
MMNQQADLIDKFYEYNLWANTEMLKFCSQLTEEQLKTELVGTPGTIRQTLEHLVSAEGVYVMH